MEWWKAENCKSFKHIIFCNDSEKITPLLEKMYELLYRDRKNNGGVFIPSEKDEFLKHLNSIISNLVVRYELDGKGCIYYQRGNKYYKQTDRVNPVRLKREMFVNVVDSLVRSRFIMHQRYVSYPDGTKYSSRMRVDRKLLYRINEFTLRYYHITWDKNVDPIQVNKIIEDSDGKEVIELIDYQDTDYSKRIRSELFQYMELLKKHKFECYIGNNPNKKYKNLPQTDFYQVRRIFREDWRQGGRFYSSFQNKILRDDRDNITIDGKETCESDFISNHFKILTSFKNQDLEFEAYDIKDLRCKTGRKLVKQALIVIINTRCEDDAIQAMKYFVKGIKIDLSRKKGPRIFDKKQYNEFYQFYIDKEICFYNLMCKLKEKHHLIREYLFTGIGLTLQKFDSEIASRIINDFVSRGKVCLCLHDSFRVLKEDKELLSDLMYKHHKEVLKLNKVNKELLIK